MKIGLIDVDSHKGYPNYALMKISAYYKDKGAKVEWAEKNKTYDIIYSSKIFTFTSDYDYSGIKTKKLYKGGTGYDISKKLPDEIERYKKLDYSIYPNCDFSIVFFSRGCIRNCKFCIVRKKEGLIQPVDPVELNPAGKWIDVMDNNFFASSNWERSIQWLQEKNIPINFRGIDIRILQPDQMDMLNKIKIKNSIFIAWDNPKDNIEPLLANLVQHIKPYKIRCYVLIGFNSSIEEDLKRIYTLQKYKILPYVMVYKDYENPKEKTPY